MVNTHLLLSSNRSFFSVVLLFSSLIGWGKPEIRVFAGNGSDKWNGEGMPAEETALPGPFGLGLDHKGRVLIADNRENRVFRVRENGTIELVAGCGFAGFAGDDGKATEAFLSKPRGVVSDATGRIWIADLMNHRIRRVDLDGTIRTVAGNGQGVFGLGTFDGDGPDPLQVAFNFPTCLLFDSDGSLLIADRMNARVRRLASNGTVSTVIGGESGGLLPLEEPYDLALGPDGELLVADLRGDRILSSSKTGRLRLVLGKRTNPGVEPMYPQIVLDGPTAVDCGPDGTLYWAESITNRVCRIGPERDLEVLMDGPRRGTRIRGGRWSADNPRLGRAADILLLPDGDLLVADPVAHCVWRITGLEDAP